MLQGSHQCVVLLLLGNTLFVHETSFTDCNRMKFKHMIQFTHNENKYHKGSSHEMKNQYFKKLETKGRK